MCYHYFFIRKFRNMYLPKEVVRPFFLKLLRYKPFRKRTMLSRLFF